jgi:hypothetical protein
MTAAPVRMLCLIAWPRTRGPAKTSSPSPEVDPGPRRAYRVSRSQLHREVSCGRLVAAPTRAATLQGLPKPYGRLAFQCIGRPFLLPSSAANLPQAFKV